MSSPPGVRPMSCTSDPVGSTTTTVTGMPWSDSLRCSGRIPSTTGSPLPVEGSLANGTEIPPAPRKDGVPSIAISPLSMFMAGEPMKLATNRLSRPVVEFQRRPDLLDDAVMHDHDLVGHGHGLDLVVGDIDRRGLEALVQFLDLGAHLDAKLGVEIGERLVEQENLRIAHDRPAHGDTLALAAGELARIACQQTAPVPGFRPRA